MLILHCGNAKLTCLERLIAKMSNLECLQLLVADSCGPFHCIGALTTEGFSTENRP
ncbi:uncharacterized protein METZ01_LOCUS229265 [marine metagenome]|uniref:Uncharacterized protein n=1 Tax=marine metagenome TaxID=408172 RepID=A0A382GQI4_9ZZZZ